MTIINRMFQFIPMKKRPKVFCIGYNKTGTTTIEKILKDLGYRCPNQAKQESLTVEALFYGNPAPLIKLCRCYDAFQDMPFSQGMTYAQVDCLFPGSKFILTIRDSNAWFDSLVRFHLGGILKSLGISDIHEISKSTFKDKAIYLHKNYLYNINKRHVSTVIDCEITYDWSLLYNRAHRIDLYESRNKEIIQHFQFRPEQLLIINISVEQDTSKIVNFLNLPSNLVVKMPHLNKSSL